MKSLLIGLSLVLFSAGLFGCARNAPEPKAEPGTVSGWYTVGAGNTLSSISVLFYGDNEFWYHLEELNIEMGIIENAALSIGDRLYIPNARQTFQLLTTTEAGTTPEATRLNSFLQV